ncbi:MAG TPA: thiamine pyrophosphate-dependent dehydrogenase E1 component subunit alpha [Gemmataceae bacterium]|nr:thiamine pyrophosphate-dependent dehydrogenase E1 component subunit alpha [Gemmataceae bacterium]
MPNERDVPEKNGAGVRTAKPRSAPPDRRSKEGLYMGLEFLPAERCRELHRIMVRSRTMEERMIKMAKSGEGYFWIGGPGEEAFNACLGLLIKKGQGPAFDFLHLHYRNEATLVALGMPLIDGIRQMGMRRTDPHSMGRNFPGHFSVPQWNIAPITSVIEVQFAMAPGSAIVQKRYGGDGVTIVVGGEAGTAEGDFASCMVWSTRPGNELPVLMIVMNNQWGISTAACTQHGEKSVVDRGKAFGIPGEQVDGNDPVASCHAIERAMQHCRRERKPFLLEAMVSRLHGHSSSSGAQRVQNENDCISLFESKMKQAGIINEREIEQVHTEATEETEAALQQVLSEPFPQPEDVERYTYAPSPVDAIYAGDYTGLPGSPGTAVPGLDKNGGD